MSKTANKEISETIGLAAGMVWKHLQENGESSLTTLKKAIKPAGVSAEMGLGWLAREGKVLVERTGRSTVARLSEM
ncbi:MAG: hypothetical protein CME06_13080 [Gemmatimonadetes bacterium]|nr:hypothetical protein [Gemmatimonadota bacterium]